MPKQTILFLFFLGVIPPLITVSIIKSISFSVYENSKAYYKKIYPKVFDQNTMLSTMSISSLAGGISGAFIATLSCPFELVKVQKQLEFLLLQTKSISTGATVMHIQPQNEIVKPTIINKTTVGAGLPVTPTAIPPVLIIKPTHANQQKKSNFTSTSSWHSAREILKKKGITGLYSGFSLHLSKKSPSHLYTQTYKPSILVRDFIGTAVYFGGYETTKYVLSGNKNTSSGPLTQFLAGGVCGIMCWIVVFPLDLVKTLIQKEILSTQPTYKSAMDCVRDIYKRNGFNGFYRGITVTLMRAFPIHSLNFLVYEQTLVLVRHMSQHDKKK